MITSCKKIKIAEYLEINDNPRQRNTELRAKTAKRKHLSEWSPAHELISVSRLPCGEMYLNDGHTRRFLIEEGHFDDDSLPKHVWAFIIDVENEEQAAENYKCYDSKESVEQASDMNYSTMKELGHVFKSERFQKPSDLGAVNAVCCDGSAVTREDWMSLWFDEIIELDEYDIPKGSARGVKKTVTAGFISGCLMLIGREYDVKDFILAVRGNLGSKSGGKKCGVQHFCDWITNTEEKTSGYEGYLNVMRKTLSCFDLWYRDHMQTKLPGYSKRIKEKYYLQKSLKHSSAAA